MSFRKNHYIFLADRESHSGRDERDALWSVFVCIKKIKEI